MREPAKRLMATVSSRAPVAVSAQAIKRMRRLAS